jgi:hypothetical protein
MSQNVFSYISYVFHFIDNGKAHREPDLSAIRWSRLFGAQSSASIWKFNPWLLSSIPKELIWLAPHTKSKG